MSLCGFNISKAVESEHNFCWVTVCLRQQLMQGPFLIIFFAKGYAYFTDWRLGGIVRVRKTDGGERMVIRRGISHIMHVKSFNADLQTGENPVIHYLY